MKCRKGIINLAPTESLQNRQNKGHKQISLNYSETSSYLFLQE